MNEFIPLLVLVLILASPPWVAWWISWRRRRKASMHSCHDAEPQAAESH